MWVVDWINANQELIRAIGSLSSFGFLVTAIIAVVQWILNERRKRMLDIQRASAELNEQYIRYLKLALNYVDLDVVDYPLTYQQRPLNQEDVMRQKVMFSILNANLERWYFYTNSIFGKRHQEWKAWDAWVSMWMKKPNYRAFWEDPTRPGVFMPTGMYHDDFERYMERKYKQAVKPRPR